MTILFSLDNYDHGTGGAEMSIRTLARLLAARGHAVQVLQRGDGESYHDGQVHVHTRPLPMPRLLRDRDRDTMRWNRRWRPSLEEFLRERPAGLVITQNRLLYSTVDVATARGIPAVVFVRAFSMFCPTQFRDRDPLHQCDRQCRKCLPWRQRLKYGTIRRNLDRYEAGLRKAPLLIANSHYMQRVIRRFYDVDSRVVYPTIDVAAYEAADGPHDSVLFVKPQYVKGLPIFLDITARLPQVRFLVAGHLRRHARMRLARLPNVECLGWVDDMRSAYARARVLLGPSIWPEPFGRVFVEAAASGVPSVASGRGGIPEAVGDAGILVEDIFDVEQWVAALRRLDGPEAYASYSTSAREHARRFAAEATLDQFLDGVREVLSLDL